ncbi:MAG TPA: chlorite dismutase family protein, partial [Acidimicrobiales bacterium]|nr:chlorite dismutase family protein [Acidimicrobiales bacterium]
MDADPEDALAASDEHDVRAGVASDAGRQSVAAAHEQGSEQAAVAGPGWAVLHLFCRVQHGFDPAGVEMAVKRCQASGHQVVTASLLGHKADLALLGLGPSGEQLRILQSELRLAGCVPEWSFVSRTEVSEYAAGVPAELREARLHPKLPPEGLPAFCFYPMSKRRLAGDNWYRLSHEERLGLMHEHGGSGRRFRGRVLQLVTGATGLDDWEWGVTLFGRTHEDLKECVYTMRFDEVSARFA